MAKRAYSPKEIVKMKRYPLKLEGEWKEAFGEPEENDTWFISGPSASGKSSFVMQLAKMLCGMGGVLYMSLEEKTNLSFQRRLELFKMKDVQGKLRVITEPDIEDLKARLHKRKSAKFVIVDSFQYTGWDFKMTKSLIDEFPRKCFIFISQEDKGRPLGKAAVRLKYEAGVKVRTQGYRAYCQGRYSDNVSEYYTIWEERAVEVRNNY